MALSFERYDRIVDHYPQNWPLVVPGYLPILNAMLDVLWARSTRPRAVLDLGCGPASATVAVSPACDPSGKVTLVDGSEEMLRVANALVQANVREALCGDFTKPELAERVFAPGFDLILSSFALHHLEEADKRTTLERAARSLAPGGLLLLGDEIASDRPGGFEVVERVRSRYIANNLSNGRISQAFWTLETSPGKEPPLPFRPARIDDLTSYMARAGLAVSCPLVVFGSALFIGVKPS